MPAGAGWGFPLTRPTGSPTLTIKALRRSAPHGHWTPGAARATPVSLRNSPRRTQAPSSGKGAPLKVTSPVRTPGRHFLTSPSGPSP